MGTHYEEAIKKILSLVPNLLGTVSIGFFHEGAQALERAVAVDAVSEGQDQPAFSGAPAPFLR
jgi:hypothetical protein